MGNARIKGFCRPTEDERRKFDSHCEKQGDCLIWTYSLNSLGYGYFQWRQKRFYCHRLNLAWYTGHMPKDLYCLHSCHTPACVSVSHLRWGTQQDNINDAMGAGHVAHGEKHTLAKYTAKQIISIWTGYYDESKTLDQLVVETGMNRTQVYKVLTRASWQHVTKSLPGIWKGRARGKIVVSKNKLTESVVREMRVLVAQGQFTKESEELYMERYGITRQSAKYAAFGVKWKHVK